MTTHVRKNTGFTIVELLIIIVVIGILAAITIVAFSGISNRANDTAVQSDLAAMGKKMQLFYAEKGYYPQTVADLATTSIVASKGSYMTTSTVTVNLGYCSNNARTGYAIFAMSKSGNRYVIKEGGAVALDTTSTTWDSSTAVLSPQCVAVSMNAPISHGYLSTDLGSGPWRAWVGGN